MATNARQSLKRSVLYLQFIGALRLIVQRVHDADEDILADTIQNQL